MAAHQAAAAFVAGNHQDLSFVLSAPLRCTSLSSTFLTSSSSTCALLSISHGCHSLLVHRENPRIRKPKQKGIRVNCAAGEPLKVMISGAPASGKGTQCRMIVEKYGLVHISTGDILRAEVSSGTEIGMMAKEYIENGKLVPDEIVTDMIMTRLSLPDVKKKGWLLDGYPRSFSQAQSLEKANIRPDIYVVLDVPDEILIDRCVGRRMDPLSGKIYHLKNFPPETDEILARLITRSDDTQEKAESRLDIYKRNAYSIMSTYSDLLKKIDGNRSKGLIFEEIDSLLQHLVDDLKSNKLNNIEGHLIKLGSISSTVSSSSQKKWRGIPTRLNNIPHSKDIREYFYYDVLQATQKALEDKETRMKVEINIPELNPEMDVYRIGTLMELVRALALLFADDGKNVKVCVQGSMGEGALSGMPLQLAGSRKILEYMDWGEYGAKDTIKIGSIGPYEVDVHDDIFILIAPQNAVGNCIIDDLQAMTDAAGQRPVILINPKLKDLPASSGIMQTMGRDKRLEYASMFRNCYFFRLLYYAGTQYPIMGAIRMSYSQDYELFKRIDEPFGKEKYVNIARFPERPTISEINDAFEGKPIRSKDKKDFGFWSFLNEITS